MDLALPAAKRRKVWTSPQGYLNLRNASINHHRLSQYELLTAILEDAQLVKSVADRLRPESSRDCA